MKKILLIILGIVIALTVIGLWVYLFTFGAPESSREMFSNFNIFGEERVIETDLTNTEPVVDIQAGTQEGRQYRRLTTRQVAGAVLLDERIRYAERGTGYIFEIDLATGQETQVTTMTVPRTIRAEFSTSGNSVALTSEGESDLFTFVGTITKSDEGLGVIEGIDLPSNVSSVAFSEDGSRVLFFSPAENTQFGGTGASYNLQTEELATLFTLPLRDVRILWGETNYVYTTPTAFQTGNLYRITDSGNLTPATEPDIALMAFLHNDSLLVSSNRTNEFYSRVVYQDEQPTSLSVGIVPEKCTHTSTYGVMYCAVPQQIPADVSFPDDWYKGTFASSDSLWSINIANGAAAALPSFGSTGMNIDVSDIGIDSTDQYLYFINKNDDSLWLFDTTI